MSGTTGRRLSDAAGYQAFVAEVSALVDVDPRRAVEVAEATTCISAFEPLLRQVQAYAFTHSGEIIGDEDLVRRGGEIWRSLARPGDPHGTYNIANAEAPLFEIVARRDGFAEAMLNRRANLRRARAVHLEIGGDESVDAELRLESPTECANLSTGSPAISSRCPAIRRRSISIPTLAWPWATVRSPTPHMLASRPIHRRWSSWLPGISSAPSWYGALVAIGGERLSSLQGGQRGARRHRRRQALGERAG